MPWQVKMDTFYNSDRKYINDFKEFTIYDPVNNQDQLEKVQAMNKYPKPPTQYQGQVNIFCQLYKDFECRDEMKKIAAEIDAQEFMPQPQNDSGAEEESKDESLLGSSLEQS